MTFLLLCIAAFLFYLGIVVGVCQTDKEWQELTLSQRLDLTKKQRRKRKKNNGKI